MADDAFLGEIRLLPYLFAPSDWVACEGQLLSTQSNAALFALLGTAYGGDGKATFALPDLRGRVVMGAQPGTRGQQGGQEAVALDVLQMPAHNHLIAASTMPGSSSVVQGGILATLTDAPNAAPALYGPLNPAIPVDPASITTTGQGQPHENMQPFTVLQYCINVKGGIYPST